MKDAALKAIPMSFTRRYCVKIPSIFWKCWRSKFEHPNHCQQVDGCFDSDAIAVKFREHFMKSYSFNDALRAKELKEEYFTMCKTYCGLPISDNTHFDTEAVN